MGAGGAWPPYSLTRERGTLASPGDHSLRAERLERIGRLPMAREQVLRYMLVFSGLVHLLHLPAVLAAPRLLSWKTLPPALGAHLRGVLRATSMAIAIITVGLGMSVVVAADEIAGGGRFAGMTAGALGVFWAYRLV